MSLCAVCCCRDLKPENVLLSSRDEASSVIKIADMGFAKTVRPLCTCVSAVYLATHCWGARHTAKTVPMGGLTACVFRQPCASPHVNH